jgi:hypothetical protein
MAEFIGVIIDTVDDVYRIIGSKCIKLLTTLQTVATSAMVTNRTLAQLRGKLVFYSICLPYLLPSITAISREIGHESDDGITLWDRPFHPSPSLLRTTGFLQQVIPQFQAHGRPIRNLPPSSLYGAFLRGELRGTRTVVITYDASVHGYAGLLRFDPADQGEWCIGTLPPHLEQVQRESAGGYRCLLNATQHHDLSRGLVLLRGDCSGALISLLQGSFGSEPLQADAEAVQRLCSQLHIELICLHVPGTRMISEGVDGRSREDASIRMAASCTETMRTMVHEMATRLQWTISIDRFATEASTLVPRFNSLDQEPAAEQQDALSVPDWDTSLCPSCGKRHREVNFIFPTRATLPAALCKLEADGARGILLLPHARRATYWPRLLAAMPPNARLGIYHTNPRRFSHLPEHYPTRIALLAVDFANSLPLPRADDQLSPPCGQETRARPPSSRISPGDARDFAAMRLQIEQHCSKPDAN